MDAANASVPAEASTQRNVVEVVICPEDVICWTVMRTSSLSESRNTSPIATARSDVGRSTGTGECVDDGDGVLDRDEDESGTVSDDTRGDNSVRGVKFAAETLRRESGVARVRGAGPKADNFSRAICAQVASSDMGRVAVEYMYAYALLIHVYIYI